MSREPPMNTFIKNLSISDKVSISCVYKGTATVIRNLDPRIKKLYTEFDFSQIYDGILQTSLIRQCLWHFKPKIAKFNSKLSAKLPVDLLTAFTLYAPHELVIRLEAFSQQFLVSTFPIDIKKLRYEHSERWNIHDHAALPLISILQSATKIDSLELIECFIDDFAATAISKLCLENLTLCEVQIRCTEIDLLIMYLTRHNFMKNLKLRYYKTLQPNVHSFLTQLINQTYRMSLESLEVSISNDYYQIHAITLSQTLKNVRINIDTFSSRFTIDTIKETIRTRPNISFEIHKYYPVGESFRFHSMNGRVDNEALIGTFFDEYPNVISINF